MRMFCFIIALSLRDILCMSYPLNDLCKELYSKRLISRLGYSREELKEMKSIIDRVSDNTLKEWKTNLSEGSYRWYLFPLGVDLMTVGKRDIGAEMILYSSKHIDSDNYVINYITRQKQKRLDQITEEDIKVGFAKMAE